MTSYKEKKREWSQSQRFLSWHNTQHEAFRAIVEMGPSVVPEILRDIEKKPEWIFLALREITNSGPDLRDIAGQLDKMCERWLDWATEQGYQW